MKAIHNDISLLRESDAGRCGARNPGSRSDKLTVHSGSCAPLRPTSNPLAKTSVAMYKITVCVWLFLFGAFGYVYAATDSSPKVEAVKTYLLNGKGDYPEVFGDKPYRMRVNNTIVADIDGDGEEEVVLHVTPHFLQSPTIIIFKVAKDLEVRRVIEGLAPGPLVSPSGNFLDSHTLGEAVDLTIGKGQSDPEKRREVARLALEKMGGVVEYLNFIHMDGRKGKGSYVDMTNLAKLPTRETCENFEFSMPDEVAVRLNNDGRGNYLLARVGKSVYSYKIHKIRDDGFLDKTLTVIPKK